jgi:hypothetical protein
MANIELNYKKNLLNGFTETKTKKHSLSMIDINLLNLVFL